MSFFDQNNNLTDDWMLLSFAPDFAGTVAHTSPKFKPPGVAIAINYTEMIIMTVLIMVMMPMMITII